VSVWFAIGRELKGQEVISPAVETVRNLTSKGAVGTDRKAVDSAGALFEAPRRILSISPDSLRCFKNVVPLAIRS